MREVQRVRDYPQQIIDLQRQTTDLQTQQFLPPQCNYTGMEQQIQTLTNKQNEARRTPAATGTDEELWGELAVMTWDAQQSGEEVCGSRTQLVNALTLAARAALAAPHALEDRGQKFPNSPDFSGSDRIQLRGWIAQLRMVIWHQPASIPDEQSKMRYAINRLRGTALGQVLPPVRDDGTIGLEDLPPFIQLLEEGFGDPDRIATAQWTMQDIKQKHCEFSQFMLKFKLSLPTLIGILRPCGMPLGWTCLRQWRIQSLIVICPRNFLPLWRFVRNGMTRSASNEWQRLRRIQAEGQVLPSPGPLHLRRDQKRPPLGQLSDIQHRRLWISAWATDGFWRKRGQRDLQFGGVSTVLGLTTEWQNVRQGRRLRRSRQLKQRLKN